MKSFLIYPIIKKTLLANFLCLMITFSFAQPNKIYANDQTISTSGICICSSDNPGNAIGSNEDDFSTLKIGLGAIATIEQTLTFPAPLLFTKLVIGIGSSDIPLSISILNGVSIELLNNTNIVESRTINSNILKIGSQTTNRATIEFNTTKQYNKVRIKLNGGLLNLNGGLRIYYAYQIMNTFPSVCTTPPFNPIYYYPFNGNIKDQISGNSFTSNTTPIFQDDMICGQGLGTEASQYTLTAPSVTPSGSFGNDEFTVSFWAKTTPKQPGSPSPSIIVDAFAGRIIIKPDSIKLRITPPSLGLDQNLPYTDASTSSIQLDHYLLIYKRGTLGSSDNILFFKNGIGVDVSSQNKTIIFGDWPTAMAALRNSIEISLDRAQIDEFIVYHKALTEEERLQLTCSYGRISNCPSPSITSSSKTLKFNETEDILTISPNPTSGQITLGSTIFLPDSDISIRNTSGKEVYHSKFKSKTFDLPSNLPDGVYILTINTKDGKTYSRKIILTR